MLWVAKENWFWLLIAAVLGAGTSAWVMLRRPPAGPGAGVGPGVRAGTATPVEQADLSDGSADFVGTVEVLPASDEVVTDDETAGGLPEIGKPIQTLAGDGVPHGRFGPGSAAPTEGGAAPHESFTIKGNEGSLLYHSPSSPSFKRTVAQHWFTDEETAVAAGFYRWNDPHRPRKGPRGILVSAIPVGSYGPGSADPVEGGGSPGEGFTVKGSKVSMLFHTTASPYYEITVADQWFASEAAARAAGFTKWSD